MPWKVSCIVDQRLQFLSSYQKEEMSISDLCREFGVSRPTGYRWINRHKGVGPEGLLHRGRRLRVLDFSNVKTVRRGFFESVRLFLSDSDRRAAWAKTY